MLFRSKVFVLGSSPSEGTCGPAGSGGSFAYPRIALRWSGVVVVALLFFGIFVALLDNVIITPLLVFISGIGA